MKIKYKDRLRIYCADTNEIPLTFNLEIKDNITKTTITYFLNRQQLEKLHKKIGKLLGKTEVK